MFCHVKCNFVCVMRKQKITRQLYCLIITMSFHCLDSINFYLLVSSADNFCKQFGPRSDPTNIRPDLDSVCGYFNGI